MICLFLRVAGRTPAPLAVRITPGLRLRNDPPRHHRGLSGRGCALQKWGKVSYSEDNIVRHRKSASKACVSRKLLCTPIHSHLHCTRLQDNLRLVGGGGRERAGCAGQGQCRERQQPWSQVRGQRLALPVTAHWTSQLQSLSLLFKSWLPQPQQKRVKRVFYSGPSCQDSQAPPLETLIHGSWVESEILCFAQD